MFENIKSTTPEKYWLLWASLKAIILAVVCFFLAFFLSLLITIPWSKHYWAGDGQAVLGGMAVSFIVGIASAIAAAAYVLRRTTQRNRVTPRQELVVWIIASGGAIAAFLLAHTFYVTAATFWYGSFLLGVTGFLFWLRFRPRSIEIPNWLRLIFNSILVLLSMVLLLYFLGVVTYYE